MAVCASNIALRDFSANGFKGKLQSLRFPDREGLSFPGPMIEFEDDRISLAAIDARVICKIGQEPSNNFRCNLHIARSCALLVVRLVRGVVSSAGFAPLLSICVRQSRNL